MFNESNNLLRCLGSKTTSLIFPLAADSSLLVLTFSFATIMSNPLVNLFLATVYFYPRFTFTSSKR